MPSPFNCGECRESREGWLCWSDTGSGTKTHGGLASNAPVGAGNTQAGRGGLSGKQRPRWARRPQGLEGSVSLLRPCRPAERRARQAAAQSRSRQQPKRTCQLSPQRTSTYLSPHSASLHWGTHLHSLKTMRRTPGEDVSVLCVARTGGRGGATPRQM